MSRKFYTEMPSIQWSLGKEPGRSLTREIDWPLSFERRSGMLGRSRYREIEGGMLGMFRERAQCLSSVSLLEMQESSSVAFSALSRLGDSRGESPPPFNRL